jgi:MFS family permease
LTSITAESVLREPNIRRLLLGQATSLLGDAMVTTALVFAILDLTGSSNELGTVLSARTSALLVGLLAGGVVADRFSRRNVMLAADIARLITQAGIAILLLSRRADVWELATLQAMAGAATAMFNPAMTGFLPQIAGDQIQQANARSEQAMSVAYLIGPAIGGVLVTITNPGWVFVIDAASYAVSAAQLARLQVNDKAPERHPRPILRDLADGWAQLRARTWLWAELCIAACNNLLFSAFMVLGPAELARHPRGPITWSMLVGALGLGVLLGGTLARRITARYPARIAARWLLLLPLPLIGLAAHLPVIAEAMLCLVAGAGNTISNVLWRTLYQRHIRPTELSRVSSLIELGCRATQPVGLATAGPAAASIGAETTLLCAGGIQISIAAAALALPPIRNLTATPEKT